MLINFLLDFGPLWGRFFCNLTSKLEGREDQKLLKNHRFFILFAFSANLSTRGYMIDFLVNLAFNLRPKTFQNSTQEASKIDQKGYRKHDAS